MNPKSILVDDLISSEVACETHFAGGAKAAAHGAAHLRGHADGPGSAWIFHEDRLDLLVACDGEQGLVRVAVTAHLDGFQLHAHPRDGRERLAHGRGNRCELVPIFCRRKKSRFDLLPSKGWFIWIQLFKLFTTGEEHKRKARALHSRRILVMRLVQLELPFVELLSELQVEQAQRPLLLLQPWQLLTQLWQLLQQHWRPLHRPWLVQHRLLSLP